MSNKVLGPVARDSVEARLLAGETNTLTEHELLEALLARGKRQRRNVSRQAKRLLERFGSLGGVISEDAELLLETPCMDEKAILLFRLAHSIATHLTREQVRTRTVISSTRELVDYCRVVLGYQRLERFLVFFLDSKNALIADELQQRGMPAYVPVFPREIIKRALVLNASSIILVHNHPSGDPCPSSEDIRTTNSIIRLAEPLGLRVLDHLIISRSRHLSFKERGLM
ncbi:MAG: DNA repair protein RadC [Parvibaculum sp.]|nr:DNA repair protein RadC [Parvibaculum sp.]